MMIRWHWIGLSMLLFLAPLANRCTRCSAQSPNQTPHRGTLTQFQFAESKIFPGTVRDVWVYVPEQVDPDQPACVAAFCDGRGYLNPKQTNYAPAIFDRLIAAGKMPPTVGVFANPGVVPPPREGALPRFNRSYEYDGLGDDYARFLNDELLPNIAERFRLKLSDDPNDRLVGGASSGGICAFNTAWSRPDWFRRVWCTVGTFVGLRGGDELHSLVRKTEAKPLRFFLHDGENDLNIYAGDWWMANQQMQRALIWMGYEHAFHWDQTGHGRDGEKKILSEALEYLWKDYPQPVTTHPEQAAPRRSNFLIPDEPWEVVSEGYGFTEGVTSNAKGEVFFTDIPASRLYKIGLDGQVNVFATETGNANGLMFHPDGRLIACAGGKQHLVAYDPEGKATVLSRNVRCNDVCVNQEGVIFFTEPRSGNIHRIAEAGGSNEVVGNVNGCNGVLLSPDQSQLYVTDYKGRTVTAFQVTTDGELIHGEPFYWLHRAPRAEISALDGMTVDRNGNLYVATAMGVQICDQAGRVNFIIPTPGGVRHPANLCFGGPEMNVLYAACGDKILRRKLTQTGLHSWEAPITPPKPRL